MNARVKIAVVPVALMCACFLLAGRVKREAYVGPAKVLVAAEWPQQPATAQSIVCIDNGDLARAVLALVSAGEPARAASLASLLPLGIARTETLRIIALAYFEIEPAAALHWVASLSDEDEKERVLEPIVMSCDEDSLQDVGESVMATLKGPARERAVKAVVARLASEEPGDALTWIAVPSPCSASDRKPSSSKPMARKWSFRWRASLVAIAPFSSNI